MSKDIKEYLHYYIGCEMYPYTLESVSNGWLKTQLKKNPNMGISFGLTIGNFAKTIEGGYLPILRKLESMTENEMIEMLKHFSKIDLSECLFEFSEDEGDEHAWVNAIENGQVVDSLDINLFDHTVMTMDDYREVTITLPQSETFHYLLSRGFDLWNLIDENLAIDKSTL